MAQITDISRFTLRAIRTLQALDTLDTLVTLQGAKRPNKIKSFLGKVGCTILQWEKCTPRYPEFVEMESPPSQQYLRPFRF